MLKTHIVGNIGELIYEYVIPTMQTGSSNDNKVRTLKSSDIVKKLLR